MLFGTWGGDGNFKYSLYRITKNSRWGIFSRELLILLELIAVFQKRNSLSLWISISNKYAAVWFYLRSSGEV